MPLLASAFSSVSALLSYMDHDTMRMKGHFSFIQTNNIKRREGARRLLPGWK